MVTAGDIACSPAAPVFNGGLGTVGADARCHQKQTSDLFAALRPRVVLRWATRSTGRRRSETS